MLALAKEPFERGVARRLRELRELSDLTRHLHRATFPMKSEGDRERLGPATAGHAVFEDLVGLGQSVFHREGILRRGRPCGRFFSGLAWSRVVSWGRDHLGVRVEPRLAGRVVGRGCGRAGEREARGDEHQGESGGQARHG